MLRTVDTYCHSCKQKTHHKVLFSKEVTNGHDDEVYGSTEYCVVQCCGCDSISFLRVDFDESWEDKDGNLIPEYTSYPFREDHVEPISSWIMPRRICEVYCEAVTAYNNKCSILAAAGFRATIEAICKNKEITGSDLRVRINNLQKKGHITLQDRDRLHSIRFMGNDSIHEMKAPEEKDLALVLEIVNNTLNNLYVLDEKTRGMEKTISSFNDFTRALAIHLLDFNPGDVVTLKDILQNDRRIMDEDRTGFEAELQEVIRNGDYVKLSLGQINASGKQEYVVQ